MLFYYNICDINNLKYMTQSRLSTANSLLDKDEDKKRPTSVAGLLQTYHFTVYYLRAFVIQSQ